VEPLAPNQVDPFQEKQRHEETGPAPVPEPVVDGNGWSRWRFVQCAAVAGERKRDDEQVAAVSAAGCEMRFAPFDVAVQKRTRSGNVACRAVDDGDLRVGQKLLERERGSGKQRTAYNRHSARRSRDARQHFAQRAPVPTEDETLEQC
jgi:hypothetical protein